MTSLLEESRDLKVERIDKEETYRFGWESASGRLPFVFRVSLG